MAEPDATEKKDPQVRESPLRRDRVQVQNVVRITSHNDDDLVQGANQLTVSGFVRPPNAQVTVEIAKLDGTTVYSQQVNGIMCQWATSPIPGGTLPAGQQVLVIAACNASSTSVPQDVVVLTVN
jgi:hypothetical protein